MKFKLPGGKLSNPLPRQQTIELYDPRIHGIRQSMLGTWFECTEKARLSIIHGWRPRVASVPFIYGTLSHGTIAGALRDIRSGDTNSKEGLLEKVPGYLLGAEGEWIKEVGHPTTEQTDIKEDSLAILGKKMPHYFNHWYDEDTDVNWQLIEDKFKVDITMDDGAVVPLIGTFDGAFKDHETNLWLFETKNKARWSPDIGTYLGLDLQVGIYLTALRALYDVQPKGVRYNLLRRPGERRKKNESMAEFSDRIEGNIIADPSHYFERMDIRFMQEEIDEHIQRTMYICEQFYTWWKRTMLTVNDRDLGWNSSSCDGKYGTCKMLNACANKDFSMYERRSPALADGLESVE